MSDIRWFRRLAGLATGVAALAAPLAARADAQDQPPSDTGDTVTLHACDEGVPEGWEVIEDASGLGERTVLCNYRIDRAPAVVGDAALSGAAITIEYFCTEDEADEAFRGKTGKRETETFRSDSKVISEEGPLAENKDNPQRDGIFSSFFEFPFTLMEKAWIRYNSHTVGTLVLLTNERAPGGPPEAERISINGTVEAVGRTIAAAHRPTGDESCFIPPIEGGGATDGAGGGGPSVVTILTVAGVITVGGVEIWRRRRPRRPGPSRRLPGGATTVPPQCVDIDRRYTTARESLGTLEEAVVNVRESLERSEKIQHHNVLRFNALAGIEAGRLIGGPLSAVDSIRGRILKPAPHQADTWKPPMNLSPAMTARLGRLRGLVDAAKQAAGVAQVRLAEAAQRLRTIATSSEVRTLRNNVAASRTALDGAKSGLRLSQLLRRDLAAVNRQIGLEARNLADVLRPLADIEKEAARLRKLISLTDNVDDLADLNADLQRTWSRLQPLKTRRTAIEAAHADLVRRRVDLGTQLDASGNVQRAHLESQMAAHDRLVASATTTEARLQAEARAAHEAAQRSVKDALNQQSMATSALAAAQRSIDLAGPLTGVSFGRRALQGGGQAIGWVLSPLVSAFERGFGRTQSIPEAYEILIRGQQHIAELLRRVVLLEKAIRQQRSVTRTLHGRVEQCIQHASRGAVEAR